MESHEITRGLSNFCYRIGCSITVKNNSSVLAYSEKSASPGSAPVFIMAEYGKGRIVALGSYELFRNDVKGGISYQNNLKLALNIFNWLIKKNPYKEPENNKLSPIVNEVSNNHQSAGELKKIIKNLDEKINKISSNQLEINTTLKKLHDKIEIIEKSLNNLKEKSQSPLQIQNSNSVAELDTNFIKASELLNSEVHKKSNQKEIESKIEMCNRFAIYLKEKYQSGAIDKTQYEEYKQELSQKIQKFQKMLKK